MVALLTTVLLTVAPAEAGVSAPLDATITAPSARLFTPQEAPLPPASALLASMATVTTGFAMMAAGTIRLSSNTTGLAQNVVMLSLGFLLFNFGPNTADYVSGNFSHGAIRGLLRIGVLLATAMISILGPIGALAALTGFSTWIALVIPDCVDSARANERWARRMNHEPAQPFFPFFSFSR